jgi:glycosyltransferase involved in cell wall biosynthesis
VTSVSIVIATRDRNDYLDYTLASLTAQTHTDFEVIVVNDGGDPATGDLVRSYKDRLAVAYTWQTHGGRAVARNSGLAQAAGERVLFVDDDRIAVPHLVTAHAVHTADAVAIGWKRRVLTVWKRGQVALSAAEVDRLRERFPEVDWSDPRHQPLLPPSAFVEDFDTAVGLTELGDDRDNYAQVVSTFSPQLSGFHLPWALTTTGNLSVDRQALMNIGGFDDRYRGWGMEDTDLGYRLHQSGLRVVVDTEAVNYHQQHPPGDGSMAGGLRRRVAESLRNTLLFCRSHPGLETYLMWHVFDRRMTILDANQLIEDVRASGSLAIEKELVHLYESTLPVHPAESS